MAQRRPRRSTSRCPAARASRRHRISSRAIRIRRASESEAPALSALALDAKQYWRYSREDIERWRPDLAVGAADIAANPTFVAELEDAVVGFYLLVPGANAWALEHLWV